MKLSEVEFVSLDDFGSIRHIASLAGKALDAQKKHLTIFVEGSTAYPNTIAPLSGLIDFYKQKGLLISLDFMNVDSSYSATLNIENPYKVESEDNSLYLDYPYDKVWTFETLKGETALVNALIMAMRKTDVCNEGILSSLEWCINETMDNVIMHSKSNKGFVMAQYHKSNKLFSFSVFDYGIGIYNSFMNSKHHPRTRADAITLALREKVTRDDAVGQGNGLWGLHQIIESGGGTLKISSDGAYYQMIFDDENNPNPEPLILPSGKSLFLPNGLGTTLIDFQMNTDKTVDIGTALNGHNLIDLWEEQLEDNKGDYVIKVSELSQGTGTRPAASELRNIALNLIINKKNKVVFDFSGVGTLSSSYADELFGKMIAEYGILFFNKKVEIINISKLNASILERSVRQRMAQSYYDEVIVDDEDYN